MPQLEVTAREQLSYPTYATAKRVVDANDITAPVEFLAWTAIRSLLIMPGLAMVGVRGKQLVFGAFLGSMMVSTAALWRTYATKQREIWQQNQWQRMSARRTRALSSGRRRRRLPARRSR